MAWETRSSKDPQDAEALAALGVHLFEQDAYEESRELLQRASQRRRAAAARRAQADPPAARRHPEVRREVPGGGDGAQGRRSTLHAQRAFDPKLLYVLGKIYVAWGRRDHARAAAAEGREPLPAVADRPEGPRDARLARIEVTSPSVRPPADRPLRASPARKPRVRRTTSAGRSSCGMWPQPSSTTSRAPGIAAAKRSACETWIQRSSRPQITSVGWRMRRDLRGHVERRRGWSAASAGPRRCPGRTIGARYSSTRSRVTRRSSWKTWRRPSVVDGPRAAAALEDRRRHRPQRPHDGRAGRPRPG